MVFPGPMLLRTFAFLAGREKERGEKHERGKLVLADIEAHFKEYGVEFGVTAGARPRLIVQLAEMGLLKGSPDAGDSAEVLSPYRVSEEHPV